jgi:hypothetical protein
MSDYQLSFDQKSLSEIAQFAGFPVLLSSGVQQAMDEGGDILVAAVEENAMSYFENPTGNLRDHTGRLTPSPYEVIITNDAPHAHRRDQGFVGADSLGRIYNDPPYLFMTDALTQKQQQVLQLIDAAASNALAKLGGA